MKSLSYCDKSVSRDNSKMATEKGSEMEVDEALDAASQEKLVPMEEGDQEAEDSERGRPSTPSLSAFPIFLKY